MRQPPDSPSTQDGRILSPTHNLFARPSLQHLGVLRCHHPPLAVPLNSYVGEAIPTAQVLPLVGPVHRIGCGHHCDAAVNGDGQVAKHLRLDFVVARTKIRSVFGLVGNAAGRVGYQRLRNQRWLDDLFFPKAVACSK
jgi:hypothetical protein